MTVARPYKMKARAASAAVTAERIVDAAKELLTTEVIADITLADIAAGAGVTVQTVLRRFGDKDAVFAAAMARFFSQISTQRRQATPGALDDTVANLMEHYEEWGWLILKLLDEETTTPGIGNYVEAGRKFHRRWCEIVFADTLQRLPEVERTRRLAQLVAICDLRTWEILRLKSGLSRDETERSIREMLAPLVRKE